MFVSLSFYIALLFFLSLNPCPLKILDEHLSNIAINITPPYIFNSTHKVYPTTYVRKNFVTAIFWQTFKLSHHIVIGGEAEIMFNQVTFIFNKE